MLLYVVFCTHYEFESTDVDVVAVASSKQKAMQFAVRDARSRTAKQRKEREWSYSQIPLDTYLGMGATKDEFANYEEHNINVEEV